MTKRVVSFLLFAIVVCTGALLALLLHFKTLRTMQTNVVDTLSYKDQEGNPPTQPIASNQWYSSLYKVFPTQPIFALPLAYKISASGLSFSYPDIVKTPNTIFASYQSDMTIGSTETLGNLHVEHIGDWDIHLSLTSPQNHSFSFFLAHGIPYTTIHTTAPNVRIQFTAPFHIISQSSQSLVISLNNHYYLLATNKPASWNQSGTTILLSDTPSLFVALLDSPIHKDLFLSVAQSDVTNTSVAYSVGLNALTTTYSVGSTQKKVLLALYPHQYDNSAVPLSYIATYQTLRGTLKLVEANAFTTSIPLLVPPLTFPKLKGSSQELDKQVNADIALYISKGPPQSYDYYLGTWFGQGATLLQLAEALGQKESKEKLLSYLTPLFLKDLQNFSYKKATTSFVATHPEFGNDQNNDHHFHYGYYIRTASILASYTPSLIAQMQPTIGNMLLDIANTNKNSSIYPYLRTFDTYESHSWADGFGNFGDGNNQESSSEAINAWYGVYLWGKITHNTQLENTGLYLYNQEILGTKYYWFDTKNMYSAPYQHAIGSIIWGGKVDFATWFSADTNMKYGIQLLPFTPASFYMGTLANFSKYQNDYFSSGGNIHNAWGDLFLMWESFYDPNKAWAEKDLAINHESNVPQSLFLYTLLYNKEK